MSHEAIIVERSSQAIITERNSQNAVIERSDGDILSRQTSYATIVERGSQAIIIEHNTGPRGEPGPPGPPGEGGPDIAYNGVVLDPQYDVLNFTGPGVLVEGNALTEQIDVTISGGGGSGGGSPSGGFYRPVSVGWPGHWEPLFDYTGTMLVYWQEGT